MLVHDRKYRAEDKLKIQTIQKLKATQKKQTMQNTATQNYSGLAASYNTQPGNEVGLFYKAPEPTLTASANLQLGKCGAPSPWRR